MSGRILCFWASLMVMLTLPQSIAAQRPDSARRIVDLPMKNRPVALRIEVNWGAVEVSAGSDARMHVELVDMGVMQRTGSRAVSLDSAFVVETHGDMISVRPARGMENSGQMVAVRVITPRATSVWTNVRKGGNVKITGVTGSHEVASHAGDVSLQNVSGSALISTQAGSIIAVFNAVTPGVPLSFATVNGAVDVTLPRTLRATLSARAFGGMLSSEFAVDGSRTLAGPGQRLSGKINGGGPPLYITTLHGAILIRSRGQP